MSAKKIVVIVLSSTLALILGFCTFWVINNYDAIEYAMSGSALYTKTDLEKAYEDGYNSAGFDVKDLNDQIKDLRNKLETKTAEYSKAKANYEEYLKKFNDLATLSEKEKAELNTTIYALNSEIAELEKDIVNLETTLETYKEFQTQLEAENKVIATFEYDGAVILLQNYEKGAKLENVVAPENTDKITFNGWTVNGQAVDISDYTINESTTFVADLTYHYIVNFTVDETLYNSQTTSNGAITLPENPTKSGYTFKGWSVDGETIVDVQLSEITSSINYIAVFNYLYKYNALEFVVEDKLFGTLERVWTDGENIYYSYGYVNPSSYSPTHYVLNKETLVWEQKFWNGYNDDVNIDGEYIWTDGENIYYSKGSIHYVLNKETSTWEKKVWNGYPYASGDHIWTDGENIFYSHASTHYVLNKETSTWEEKVWNGRTNFNSESVWTDGENYYISTGYGPDSQLVLNKETSTWENIIWKYYGDDVQVFSPYGTSVWNDGENIYYSAGTGHFVLDKATLAWQEKTWDGISEFSGANVWTDGENYYMSYDTGKTYKFVLK